MEPLSSSSGNLTLEHVLQQLQSEGLLTDDAPEKARNFLTASVKGDFTPWYIYLLVGLAAWWSAILFIIFLFAIRLLDEKASSLLMGLALGGGAIILRRLQASSVFFSQLALASNIAGQVLFLLGVANLSQSVLLTALAAIGLQVIMLLLYPDFIQRFLAPGVIVVACCYIFYELDALPLIHLLVTLLAWASGYLWLRESRWLSSPLASSHRPVSYGLAVSLLNLLLCSIFTEEWSRLSVGPWWLSSLGLALGLFYLEYRLLRHYALPWTSPNALTLLVGSALICLIAAHSPGLLAAIFVLILGFERGNRTLLGLAILFLVVFLSAYYYQLAITLLTKSLILMGTGVVLLGLRFCLSDLFSTPPNDSLQAHSSEES